MRFLFWLSFGIVVYAYVGYAVWLWLFSRLHRRPVLKQTSKPPVSVIIAAHNEEATLPAKLANLRLSDYPADRLQIIVASDGSTDRTVEILEGNAPAVVPVILHESHGKATALNQAVRRATGDILVFFDARQSVEHDAVSQLVSC